MDIEEALVARLRADTAVAALLARTPDDKPAVHWDERPQSGGLPAVTLQTVFEDHAQNFTGFDGLQRALIQVDAWALTRDERKALKDATIAALVPPWSGAGIGFERATLTAQDSSESDETRTVFRSRMDFTFHHRAQEEG